jgi:phosphohistidine swiveling domain-containing protein
MPAIVAERRLRATSGPEIVTLSSRILPEQVGGKFHRQSLMIRAGIAVPPFFCLTASFYRRVMAQHLPAIATILRQTDPEQRQNLKAAETRIQRIFAESEFSDGLEDAVLKTFDRVFADAPLVSVRASMIGDCAAESEDSAQNPFAGISESFLYVNRQQVVEKIRLAMASGFGAAAILYRHKQGMDAVGFSVAVGIQRMVFAERSFVAFTCNPQSAVRETVLIAGYGAGEGVVQERVPVDHFFFNPLSKEVRSELADKDRKLTLAPEGYGLAMEEVAPALRTQPSLSHEQVSRIAELGSRIEKLFRAPQDIEGALTADGDIHILQARPIALDVLRQRVWSNANVTESFPGVTTPLTYTLARYFYRVIFYDCYRLLGIPPRQLHDQYEPLDRMIGFLGGRIYYSLTSFYRLHSKSPLFPIFQAHWEKMMGFPSSYEIGDDSVLGRATAKLQSIVRLVKAVIVIAWRYITHEREVQRFQAWWDALIAPRRDRVFEREDPLVVMADFHEVWRQVGNHWGITLLNDTYLPVVHGWLEGLFRHWNLTSGSRGEGLLSGLLCGDEELVSVDIILSAVRLAEQVRANPSVDREFRRNTPEALWEKLDAGQMEPAFTAGVREHLNRYGDRGFEELKVEQPNLRQCPWILLRMVQTYARDELTVESFRIRQREERDRAEVELAAKLRGHPLRRLVAKFLTGRLRKLIRNRENCRYCRSELFSYSKNVFSAMGQSLIQDGRLRARDDIFYLTQDEIFGFLDGTGVTDSLQVLADLRRKEAEENRRRETGMQITTLGPVRRNNIFAAIPAPDGGGVLHGLGSSAGKIRGIAHVVLDPTQPVELGTNGILIARETDPGWLFLMLSSKGIVVERGSMLSHTAITGRQFGIPTVVSLPQATTRIANGAWIEVDGASGLVTLLTEDAAFGIQ